MIAEGWFGEYCFFVKMKRREHLESRELNLKFRSGFTLIELCVVVAIMAILLALLTPSLTRVMDIADVRTCAKHQSSFYLGYSLYENDFDGSIPLPLNSKRGHAFYKMYTYPIPSNDAPTLGNIATFYRDGYISSPYMSYCPTYPVNKNSIKALQTLVSTGSHSQNGASAGYIMRGRHHRGSGSKRGVSINNIYWWSWGQDADKYDIKLGYSDTMFARNAAGARVPDDKGKITLTTSARAMLMCILPEKYYSNKTMVHDAKTFNIMFADGYVGEADVELNPKFFSKQDAFYLRWTGADTQHPSFERPAKHYGEGYYY